MLDVPRHPGRWPGVLVEWRRDPDGWAVRVVYGGDRLVSGDRGGWRDLPDPVGVASPGVPTAVHRRTMSPAGARLYPRPDAAHAAGRCASAAVRDHRPEPVLVRPGARLPTDGQVTTSSSWNDQGPSYRRVDSRRGHGRVRDVRRHPQRPWGADHRGHQAVLGDRAGPRNRTVRATQASRRTAAVSQIPTA